MPGWMEERKEKLREFFGLKANTELIAHEAAKFELGAEAEEGLRHFHIEWHVIPSADAVPLDDSYFARLYPTARRDFTGAREHKPRYIDAIRSGHEKHQGTVVGVETTIKPRYLPENRQFYGTLYGHDASADPLAPYMGLAGMMNGTRYDHNYLSLREFLRVVNEDWRARGIMPAGYRVTVCPPAVFNIIGTLFHREWSETESLEISFYRDREGNATCYAVGANASNDFSYINEIEGEAEWSLMGFRLALIPE